MKFTFSSIIILICVFSIFSQTKMSDREVKRFKGKVWKVTEEVTHFVETVGKFTETPRETLIEMEFAKNGNFLRSGHYSSGKLFMERKFDSLNNERIFYETMFTNGNAAYSVSKKYNLKFKYDGRGRRIEEAWFNNEGKLVLRNSIKYDPKGNDVEWLRDSSIGVIRSFSEFDNNGNISKTIEQFAAYSYGFLYEYEFDSKGNWSKRITKKLTERNGKSEFEPYEAHYRKIAYFTKN